MKTVLIVFHSRTGAARQMAEAAAQGAGRAEGVRVRLLPAAEAAGEDVLAADGCIFAAPENLGSLSGAMKEFFDRAYYAVLDRAAGRPYALLVSAGSDGQGAARQVARIATGWRMKAIAEPLIVNLEAQTPQAILAEKTVPEDRLRACAEIGQTLGEGLALGVF